MQRLIAWHGDPTLKARTVGAMAAHRAADELIKGVYWWPEEHRGCAVGCLTEDPDGGHDQYPTRWGIPEELAWLEDAFFENLPAPAHKDWPVRFLSAIEPGADLTRVYSAFAARLMLDPEHGNVTRCGGYPDVEAAVRAVGDLHGRHERGEDIPTEAYSAAGSAVYSAARSARSAGSAAYSVAYSAESARSAYSAAGSAAYSATYSAAYSARSAADSARSAWDSAYSAHYVWMADLLVGCLRTAPSTR